MKHKFFTFILLQITMLFCAANVCAQDKEPYAVYNEDETVLTFYYDELKSERNGMDVGPFTVENLPEWYYNYSSKITKAVFDKSFADCNTLTSTALWFAGFTNLTEIIGIENLKTDNVTDMASMFADCNLTSLDLSGFKTDNVIDMSDMFGGCHNLIGLDLSSFTTDKVTNMSVMFGGCYNLIGLDLSSFTTDKVTNMSGMFMNCRNLIGLDLSGFKTDNVTNMIGMFMDCRNLIGLDLSSFTTDKVTNMSGMFEGCKNLTSLDLSGFKTDNVTDMGGMFGSCTNLTSLDLSSFKTGNVTDMDYMFYRCSLLKTIYAGNGWSTASLDEYGNDGIFYGCESLVGGAGTTYDANHVGSDYARIDGGPDAPGYFTYKTPTGIQSITQERRTPAATYNLSGSKLAAPQKGINIIDGRKVIVK